MTREEAIKELKILKEDYWDDDGYGHETKQYDDTMLALDIAIKALEQEPCGDAISRQTVKDSYYKNEFWMAFDMAIESLGQEPCEDAISRENLLLWLDNIKKSARKHVGFLLDVQRYIRSMSPVNPQPKTGYWIDKDVRGSIEPYCSVCGDSVDTIYHYNYCPNCGAKMAEPQESEG